MTIANENDQRSITILSIKRRNNNGKVGKAIVKLRIPILILSVLLLIPAGIGYVKTKVNYDILYYLPGDIDTMKGQDILMDEFNKGAYATVVVKGMDAKGIER